MGCFSWLDCKDDKQIRCGRVRDVFVLVPQDFGGGNIKETYYDGYGNFGGYDIYELVADWNKNDLDGLTFTELKQPDRLDYSGLYSWEILDLMKSGLSRDEIDKINNAKRDEQFSRALKRYDFDKSMVRDFSALSDDEMIERYGDEYKRELGILIACYDEDNKKLKYPIKITYDANAVYEDCKPSLGDPNQGCPPDDDDDWY